jgi:hypothetical protein
MSPAVAALTIAIAIAALVIVLVLVRRQRLKERYAAIWLLVASGMVVLAVFRPLLDRLSDALGIQSGTTTVFLLAVLVILVVQLQLSMSLSTLEEKVRDLAEAVALSTGRKPEWSPPVGDADDRQGDPQPGPQDGVDES